MHPRSYAERLWLLSTEATSNAWRKVCLFSIGALHFIFSSDAQWQNILPQLPPNHTYEQDLNSTLSSPSTLQNLLQDRIKTNEKRIIFIRHAESDWNEIFNNKSLFHGLLAFTRNILREGLTFPTDDSIFIDSPLSKRGWEQTLELYQDVCKYSTPPEFISSAQPFHLLSYLGRPLPNSLVVSSNLRRAIDTARIASSARLELPNEQIHVLSSLQEIGRGLDTITISDAYKIPPSSLHFDTNTGILSSGWEEKPATELLNLSESHGNKAVLGCGRTRIMTFAKWIMCQNEEVFIVYGHSNWFLTFCQEFFPQDIDHDAKKVKLKNCGVVSFMLSEYRSQSNDIMPKYLIDAQSFQYIR